MADAEQAPNLNDIMMAIHREIELRGPAGLSRKMEGETPRDLGYMFQKIRLQVIAMQELYGLTGEKYKAMFTEELVVLAAMVVATIGDQGLPNMDSLYDPKQGRRPLWERSWRSTSPLP